MNVLIYMLLCFYIILLIIPKFECVPLKSINFTDCDIKKSCLTWSTCTIDECDHFLGWKTINIDNNKVYLEVELIGTLQSNENGYVAMGFSEDQKMGNDEVIGCYMFNSSFSAAVGYNPKYYNEFVKKANISEDFLVYQEENLGISFDTISRKLSCRIRRLLESNPKSKKLKDLPNYNYYVMASIGKMTDNIHYSKHYKGKHFVSENKYNFTSNQFISTKLTNKIPVLIKVHGIFMIIGWIFFLSNGILIAGVYRNNWIKENNNIVAKWFQLHRILQLLGTCFVILGFIIIFIHTRGKYSQGLILLPDMSNLTISMHPILGIISTILLLLNPINSLFRCKPNHPNRQIFNWIHWFCGISSYVLAMINLIIGMIIPRNIGITSYPWIIALCAFICNIVLYIIGKILFYRNNFIAVSLNNDESEQISTKKKPVSIILLLVSIIIGFISCIALCVILIVH